MLAFGTSDAGLVLRTVDLPSEYVSVEDVLNASYHYGQNDFQPRRMRSVSVGDVIRVQGRRFRVDAMGFSDVATGESV